MIVEALKSDVSSDATRGIAFYYCDYKDSATQYVPGILRSLIKHAAVQNEQSFDNLTEFIDLHRQEENLRSPPDLPQLQNLFLRMTSHYETFYLVIDALDEYTDTNRYQLLNVLNEIRERSPGLRIICTSREEADIKTALEQYSKVRVRAEASDLEIYVASEIELRLRDGRLSINHTEVKDEIIDKLSHHADGMSVIAFRQ